MSCPFHQKPPQESPATKTPSNSACPYADSIARSSADGPPSCPLGFGRTSGPSLSPLHCLHCRALLHAPVKVKACGHKFCKFCVSKFRDCPLCGIDIDLVISDDETEELVSKFLEAHAGNPALWSKLVAYAGGEDTSKSGFFLQLGMQSFAGGNLEAAACRLQRCKEELLQQQQQQQQLVGGCQGSATEPPAPESTAQELPSSSGSGGNAAGDQCAAAAAAAAANTPPQTAMEHADISNPCTHSSGGSTGGGSQAAALSCKLGAVCGSLADCYKQLGQLDRAAELYEESIGHLLPHAEGDQEVAHALSVSYNKQGDLHYVRGDLQQSRQNYMRGLVVRQRALTPGTTGDNAAEQVLSLAVSAIKVADASKGLGDDNAARKYSLQARQLLQPLDVTNLPPNLAAKRQQLVALLEAEFEQ